MKRLSAHPHQRLICGPLEPGTRLVQLWVRVGEDEPRARWRVILDRLRKGPASLQMLAVLTEDGNVPNTSAALSRLEDQGAVQRIPGKRGWWRLRGEKRS